ncbi:MAG: ORF6N domain-containing protein [Lentimicrobiaceae bacterium]|nr:ORF6N domain-containing protein [Lentimicrobiaceae bacterium]
MNILKFNSVEEKIISIRGIPAILDSDVAEIYGVETKEINQAVKNNPEKFPKGFILELDKQEFVILRSKILTAKWAKTRFLPKAFTEPGLYMLATILKGPKATQATLDIIQAFTKFRELSRALIEITQTTDETKHKLLLSKSGNLLNDLLFNDLQKVSAECSVEFNLGLMKIKHQIRKERKSMEEQNELKEILRSILKKLEEN